MIRESRSVSVCTRSLNVPYIAVYLVGVCYAPQTMRRGSHAPRIHFLSMGIPLMLLFTMMSQYIHVTNIRGTPFFAWWFYHSFLSSLSLSVYLQNFKVKKNEIGLFYIDKHNIHTYRFIVEIGSRQIDYTERGFFCFEKKARY